MKAARYYGPGDIRVEETEEPQPWPNEAVISVEWCGLCGSDLHEYIGPTTLPTKDNPHPITNEGIPFTFGHEFCGRVKSAPSSAPHLKPGTLVICDPKLYCGSCDRCQISATHACTKLGFVGISGRGGGFSEVVPVDARLCHPLPDSMPPDNVPLIEPLAVAHHAFKLADIPTDDGVRRTVLILGGGPIGQALIYVLRAHRDNLNIVLSDPFQVRRDTANRADRTLNPTADDVTAYCCQSSRDSAGADVVFDCAGIQPAAETGFAALRYRGVYVTVALWEHTFTLPFRQAFFKELQLRFSAAYTDQDFAETVRDYVAGKYAGIEGMVTDRIGLDEVVEKGFEALVKNRGDHVKILVTPKRGNLTSSTSGSG